MADNNLVQQIDRISYAVAGVVGLAVLILPALSGGNLAEIRQEVNTQAGELAKKKQEQIFPPLPERNLEDEIEAQWRSGAGGDGATWVTGATPALVKRAKSIKRRPAVHSPGVIAEMSAHRDSEKQQVYLVVKGAMGLDNEFVVIKSVKLSRREGDGPFKEIGTFDGDFEYRDEKVKPGQVYAYLFTTEASRDSGAPSNILAPEDSVQESVELETPPIPYDFSVNVRQTLKAKQLGERPKVMAEFYYWDYATDARAGKRDTYTEKDEPGGKRYTITRVDTTKRSITVRDNRGGGRYEITSKDQPFPLELWPPVTPAPEEETSEEDAEEEEEVAEEPEPEPAKAPTRTAPRRTRRGF